MHWLGDFSQITSYDFIRFAILQIIYENYYHEQLAKISTCVKYSTSAFHRYINLKYISPSCSGNVNFRDYHGGSLNFMFSILCFPGFLTISHSFPWCFGTFLPVFLRFPLVFLLFPRSVCPFSFSRFCDFD